jgi:hypothetical protein
VRLEELADLFLGDTEGEVADVKLLVQGSIPSTRLSPASAYAGDSDRDRPTPEALPKLAEPARRAQGAPGLLAKGPQQRNRDAEGTMPRRIGPVGDAFRGQGNTRSAPEARVKREPELSTTRALQSPEGGTDGQPGAAGCDGAKPARRRTRAPRPRPTAAASSSLRKNPVHGKEWDGTRLIGG